MPEITQSKTAFLLNHRGSYTRLRVLFTSKHTKKIANLSWNSPIHRRKCLQIDEISLSKREYEVKLFWFFSWHKKDKCLYNEYFVRNIKITKRVFIFEKKFHFIYHTYFHYKCSCKPLFYSINNKFDRHILFTTSCRNTHMILQEYLCLNAKII